MIFIGIDIGFTGAIACMNDNEVLWIEDMPLLVRTAMNGKDTKEIDSEGLRRIIAQCNPEDNRVHICVEEVHAMPKSMRGRTQGVVSAFSFGVSKGKTLGVIETIGIPYTRVAPQTWKAHTMKDMGKDKSSSVVRALQLYPECRHLLIGRRGGMLDGRGDALLMAHYMKTITDKDIDTPRKKKVKLIEL